MTAPRVSLPGWAATRILLPLVGLALSAPATGAVTFTDIGAGLTGVTGADVAWGDYDNDGDLDIVAVGATAVGTRIARIYCNDADSSSFSDTGLLPGSAGVDRGGVAWGDYDLDGDLDLALTGDTGSGGILRIYRNDVSAFAEIPAGLPGLTRSAVAWGDYDRDGDLDLVAAGLQGSQPFTGLFRNDDGTFAEVVSGLPAGQNGALAWADYDNDGDPDLAMLGGESIFDQNVTGIYRNDAGSFVDIGAGLSPSFLGSVEWGDFDNDGDPDLLLTGNFDDSYIYVNTAGSFAATGGFGSLIVGDGVWGDLDSDGDLDLVVAGSSGSGGSTTAFLNTGGGFSSVSGLPDLTDAALALGDYDNDGDLDLLVAGDDFNSSAVLTRIYSVSGVPNNSPPTPPTGLYAELSGGNVTFQWNAATDPQGGAGGLSYNLRVGTTPNGGEIVPAMAASPGGYRRVAQLGNVGQQLQWTMPASALGGGGITWSLQAVDQAFAGSPFAAEASVVGVPDEVGPGSALALRSLNGNPFHFRTRVAYTLERATPVELSVHDANGRLVRTLHRGFEGPGSHQHAWLGDNDGGQRAPAGLYFVRLSAGEIQTSLKLVKVD